MSTGIFIHGLESSNQGTKALFFRERYPEMLIPNFPGSLEERMEKLDEVLFGRSDLRIVGSSFGGLMASLFAMQNIPRVEKLILLAPAIHLIRETPYEIRKIPVPAHIYHGTRDEVIPLKDVEREASKIFPDLTFNVVDDDHFLHNTFKTIDWDAYLLK